MSTTTIYSGEVSSGLVADYSNTIIVSGGTAVDTTIDYGAMSVFIAGAQVSNTVMSGGILYASTGQIENTTMDDGAVFSAMYSVDITGTTINSGGSGVFRASSVKDTIVNSGGRIDIYGGTVTNTTVNQGSMSLANSNAAAYNTFITGSGYYIELQVQNCATITGTTVESSAYLRLSSGAVANDTILNRGGNLTVSSGATAANTTINEGGSMSIEGGNADLVTVNFGGWFSAGYSYDGATSTASATRVTENGGEVYVGSGSSYGYDSALGSYTYKYYTYPVEFVSNTFSGLVYSDYREGTVHSGTTAVDITAVAGGLTVYSGGIVNGYRATPTAWTSTYEYWEYSSHLDEETGSMVYESSLLSSAVEVTTVGGLTVYSGGIVTGLVAAALPGFEDSGAYLDFQIARDTEITGTIDGTAFEMKNGALSNASLKDANLTYMSGAFAQNVTQINGSASFLSASYAGNLNFSGGGVTFNRGAAADGVRTFVIPYTYTSYGMGDSDGESVEILVETSRGASVSVLAGATVTNLDMDSESYLHMQVAPFTVLQGTSGGQTIDLKNGYFGNASLGNTYVEVLGPSSYVDEITQTTVNVSAGTVGNLIANMHAVVSASSGTTALNMTENGGAVFVAWDYEDDVPAATATFTSNTFSYDDLRGEVTVHKNTIAQDNILYEGSLNVYSGGIVNNFYTAPKDMGMLNAFFGSGAIVSNFDMTRYAEQPYHPGEASFDRGVSATLVRLTDWNGLTLNVDATTVITNASLDNVPFSVEGGVLSGFYANGDGWFSDYVTVTDGGRMVDCYINSWGSVILENGASASNVTFASNYIYVSSGSLLENATIGLPPETIEEDGGTNTNYNSATVYVKKGGVMRDFTVNEFSKVYVSSGGKLTGTMRFEGNNAGVIVSSNAVVEFDLTSKDALSQARVDNLTAVNMNRYARYDIVVDAQQAAGSYVLANYYHSDYETTYNLVSVSGSTYGYFRGGEVYKVPGDPDTAVFGYIYHAESETQPGFGFKLDCVHVEVEGEEGAYTERLVLTVDSTFAPTAYVAAPVVTASAVTFTNDNVVLTATADENAIQYSLDGTNWQAYVDGVMAPENGKYYFRAVDGTAVSDVVSYTVSNIDKVAPTLATGLSATVIEGSTATLSWTDATDDFSGVSSFYVACWQDGGASYTEVIPGTTLTVDSLADGTWHWALQTIDYAGNASAAAYGADFVVSGSTVTPGPTPPPPTPAEFVTKSDIDGNGISDVLFVWTGNNYQQGYWMNGTATWQSANAAHPSDWIPLGAHDMNNDGKADSVMFGNVWTETSGKGAYIGYYIDADDASTVEHPTWQNIGYLNNEEGIAWQNCVGNLNGEKNSIVWYAPDLYATGIWVGVDEYPEWIALSASFGGNDWNLVGCGDFDGDGKDSVVMNYNKGQLFYEVEIGGKPAALGSADWRGWDLRAIGDFAGDGKEDIVLFHEDTGSMVMCADGNIDAYTSIGQLAADDWFVVGAGDYNGDKKDDLLVRQKSTGMLGYYVSGDTSQWVEMGRGVDMDWTVIA